MPDNPTISAEIRRTARLSTHEDYLLLSVRAKMEERLRRVVTINEVLRLAILCLADQEHCE